jgi:hypothetical protein
MCSAMGMLLLLLLLTLLLLQVFHHRGTHRGIPCVQHASHLRAK